MTENFDILCNNCGQNIRLRLLSAQAGFQEFATCPNCQTHLKIEETETTIETIVVTEREFLTTNQTPIPAYQNNAAESLIRLREYEEQLRILESEWSIEIEMLKVTKRNKQILPRKNRSLGLSVLGFVILLYAIIIDKGEATFLSTIGVIVLFTSGQEFYKWWRYKEALADFEEEKEKLEMGIELMDN